MFKKSLILSLLSVLLFGCTVKQNTEAFFGSASFNKTEIPLSGHINTVTQSLPAAQRLSVLGPFNVHIQVVNNPYMINPHNLTVTLSGDSALLEHAQDFVQNGTLKIYMDKSYAYDPNAKIDVTLVISPNTLAQIYYRGQGEISMQPINGKHLALIMDGSGYAFLAGQIDRLDLTAKGNARINAKCVYAQAIFVNTVDTASAEVLGGEGVSGLAADQSNIYYYGRPDLTAPYQRQSGSMMRMEGILPSQTTAPAEPSIPADPKDFGIK